ncbi:MAG: hypothetical protein ACTSRU_16950 [Candidatus Hodarchaeales archaeon]
MNKENTKRGLLILVICLPLIGFGDFSILLVSASAPPPPTPRPIGYTIYDTGNPSSALKKWIVKSTTLTVSYDEAPSSYGYIGMIEDKTISESIGGGLYPTVSVEVEIEVEYIKKNKLLYRQDNYWQVTDYYKRYNTWSSWIYYGERDYETFPDWGNPYQYATEFYDINVHSISFDVRNGRVEPIDIEYVYSGISHDFLDFPCSHGLAEHPSWFQDNTANDGDRWRTWEEFNEDHADANSLQAFNEYTKDLDYEYRQIDFDIYVVREYVWYIGFWPFIFKQTAWYEMEFTISLDFDSNGNADYDTPNIDTKYGSTEPW